MYGCGPELTPPVPDDRNLPSCVPIFEGQHRNARMENAMSSD